MNMQNARAQVRFFVETIGGSWLFILLLIAAAVAVILG